jgi:serine/threonine protein kinase
MAPEIIQEEYYNKAIDIWSLGILLYELIHGYSPFRAQKNSRMEIHQEVLNNIILCSNCQQSLDATGIEYFTKCECSSCGSELIVPKQFGKIVLQYPIGKKSVFEAYDAFDLERKLNVCAYIMKPDAPDYKKLLEIARHEIELLSQLKQNNINPLIASDFEDGAFYVEEQLPDGYNMSTYDPETQPLLSIDNVIEIMKSVALALATAHHREIPHYDISPENIHLDSDGNVKLKSFFISRFMYEAQRELNIKAELSPYFISPEKLEKSSETKKGDIFSLGAVFYFLLTGKYPFDGADEKEILYSRVKKAIDFSKSPEELAKENKSGAVKYKAPHPPYKLRAEIPQPISEMLVTALSYYPDSRPVIPHILDTITENQAVNDKEKNFLSAQRKMILAKTIASVPKKEGGLRSIFKF